MASSGQYRFDYANAINVTVGAASNRATLPINRELFALSADCNCRFRTGLSASVTAVATDPLITPNSGPVILRIASGSSDQADTGIAAIGDPATPNTGLLSVCPVYED